MCVLLKDGVRAAVEGLTSLPSSEAERTTDSLEGGEGTADCDTVAPNCSTGSFLSSFDERISSKSSN